MRNWKQYYNKESDLVKTTLKDQLHRVPDRQDYKRIMLIKRLDTNIVDIYLDDDFVKSELLIPEKV